MRISSLHARSHRCITLHKHHAASSSFFKLLDRFARVPHYHACVCRRLTFPSRRSNLFAGPHSLDFITDSQCVASLVVKRLRARCNPSAGLHSCRPGTTRQVEYPPSVEPNIYNIYPRCPPHTSPQVRSMDPNLLLPGIQPLQPDLAHPRIVVPLIHHALPFHLEISLEPQK